MARYTVFPELTMIEVRPVQPVKARLPIEDTESGIVIDVILLQLLKAPSLIK